MNFESTTSFGNKSRHGGTLTINNGEAKYDIGIYVTYKGQLRITGKLEQLLYSENIGTGECVKPTNLSVSSAGCTASIRFNKIELTYRRLRTISCSNHTAERPVSHPKPSKIEKYNDHNKSTKHLDFNQK
jgi:hypothetical protein